MKNILQQGHRDKEKILISPRERDREREDKNQQHCNKNWNTVDSSIAEMEGTWQWENAFKILRTQTSTCKQSIN